MAIFVCEIPTARIAKNIGASDEAVEKWCKQYGIEKPPRGYCWVKQAFAELVEPLEARDED